MDALPRSVLVCGLILTVASSLQAQVRVSVSTAGVPANAPAVTPTLSGDGRFVAFASAATNLVAADSNADLDVFLHDRDADGDGVFDEPGAIATVRASATGTVQGNSASYDPVISQNGRYVVFLSRASSLAGLSTPPFDYPLIYRFDRLTGEIRLVTQSHSGAPADAISLRPQVSSDGRYVLFITYATNLIDENIGTGGIVVLRDMETGAILRISDPQPPPAGTSVFYVDSPGMSGDARVVAFVNVEGRLPVGQPVAGTVVIVDRTTGARWTRAGTQVGLSRDGTIALVSPGTDVEPVSLYREHLPSGERRVGPAATFVWASPSGRYAGNITVHDYRYGTTCAPRFTTAGFASDDGDRVVAMAARLPTTAPGSWEIAVDSFDHAFDRDADGLSDFWETSFGLAIDEATGATGENGPAGDADGDGVTNAQELAAGTHPRGTHARYLAEGATGGFFRTRIALANPGSSEVRALVRFERGDGTHVVQHVPVGGRGRLSIYPAADALLGHTDFASVVESDGPVVVDRLMTWGDGDYGSHAETATVAPATTWFLAEGTTVMGFQLFYLLQNPQSTATTASVRFLLPGGVPVMRTYELPARSRTTIFVNTVPGLGSTDVSGEITATQPIVVERAMYRNTDAVPFVLGHAASGVTQASTSWFLAEGATGSFFDTYVLVANPSAQPASVQIDFLPDHGAPVSRTYTVAASSRFSLFVDSVPGLEAASFGARVTSTVPVVVERAMYWAGGFFDYYEGHVSAAVTQTGARWVLAEGEAGGPLGAETYVLLANTGSAPMTVSIRVLPEPGTVPWRAPQQMTVPANGRVSVPLSALLQVTGQSQLAGVEVTELGAQPTGALVVEGAIYRNVGTELWGAGASLPATRMP